MEISSTDWGLISAGLTVVSTGVGVWAGRRFKPTVRSIEHHITWEDFAESAEALGEKVIKGKFVPDVLVSCSMRGAFVCFLLERGMRRRRPTISLPMVIGDCQWKEGGKDRGEVEGYERGSTNKWTWYLPTCIKDINPTRILVVDDFAMTGQSLEIIAKMVKQLCPQAAVKCAAIYTSDTLVAGKNAPDFYVRTASSTLIFPWGRIR